MNKRDRSLRHRLMDFSCPKAVRYEAAATLGTMSALLQRYGRHLQSCLKNAHDKNDCTCGFDAAKEIVK